MADRHRFRAEWHDYDEGIYFVTVCCKNKEHLLGHIENGEITLLPCGQELQMWIKRLKTNSKFEIVNHVIMPNHFHLLVGTRFCEGTQASQENTHARVDAQKRVPTGNIGCLKPPKHGEAVADFHHNSALAVFVGNLKGGIVRFANRNNIYFAWQERFHDHIVKYQQAFNNISNYIDNNVANWHKDCFNQ